MKPATVAGPPSVKGSALFVVKTPAGGTEELTQQQILQRIRMKRVLPWDLISEGGDSFSPILRHAELGRHFSSAVAEMDRHCWKHRTRVSQLVCGQCGRGFCQDCQPAPERSGLSIRTCPACDAVLQPGDPRWGEKPFWKRLDEVLVFPLKDASWVTTAGLGVLSWLGSWSWRGRVLLLIALAYLFHVVSRSAKGDKKMGMPDSTDITDLAGTGAMALLVTALVFLPIILFNVFVVFRSVGEEQGMGQLFFLNVPLGLATFAYYPMALGMSAVWHNKWLALRPDVVVSHILKIKKDYLILLGVLLGITAVQWVLEMLARAVPILGSLVASFLSAYASVIEAHILGWTLYMKAEELGWK